MKPDALHPAQERCGAMAMHIQVLSDGGRGRPLLHVNLYRQERLAEKLPGGWMRKSPDR